VLVRDLLASCELLWPRSGAEDWDRPGLTVGSGEDEITSVLLSVDITEAVLAEAIELGASVILSHHPLLLRGVSYLSEETSKGQLVSKAIRAGISLLAAHTNADIVEDGVSDVLAKALQLSEIAPLVKTGENIGHGRIGALPAPTSIGDLVERIESWLPVTARGISSTATRTTVVQRVAVCGGAGDSFIGDAVAAGADVYITSDLRHHVAQESGVPLIDVSHWASESMWLSKASEQLEQALPGIKIMVSAIATDPWAFNSGRNK
jgi:dinuclear metal center YbgI/SA1388 family protein